MCSAVIAAVYSLMGVVEFNYVFTDFLHVRFVVFERGVDWLPAVIVESSLSPCSSISLCLV